MDLEKFEKMIELTSRELSKYSGSADVVDIPLTRAKLENLLSLASKIIPDHRAFLSRTEFDIYKLTIGDAHNVIEHIREILELEKASETKIKAMKIFESAEDKMKQANISFRKDDYTSVFHNLNTVLELVLKDKVGIPTTITKINTSTIIDILVKEKVESHLYLVEAKKHILKIDNKIKHQSYSPSKIDCINAIKVMEELISRLRGKELKLTEETRNKIYKAL